MKENALNDLEVVGSKPTYFCFFPFYILSKLVCLAKWMPAEKLGVKQG